MSEKPQGLAIGEEYPDSNRYNFVGLQSFAPRYDLEADYNTNAEGYFKALAKTNYFLKYRAVPYINHLIFRNMYFDNTNTLTITKTGDWYDNVDEVRVKADVNISKQNTARYSNAIYGKSDGLYAKDFTGEIADIHNIQSNHESRVSKAEKDLLEHANEIASLQLVDKNHETRLKNAEAKIVDYGIRISKLETAVQSDEERINQVEYFTQRYVMQGYELLIEHDLGRMPKVQVETYTNAIDTETDGFGTSNEFGGSASTMISSEVQYLDNNRLTVKMPIEQRMSGQLFRVDNNWYVINHNKTMKFTLV